MTDRELLELAAKAAGIEGEYECWTGQGFKEGIRQVLNGAKCLMPWNPLTDDGDALRLAVKLRIKFRYNEAMGQGLAWTGGAPDFEGRADIEKCGRDENACARRAITRAAAEIGRSA